MSSIFNEDSPFMSALSRISDVIILNVLFIVTCLPIITIGDAITSMTYTAMKAVRYEDGYVAKRYLKAFKQNFKQSTCTWLLMLAAGIILFFDVYFWVNLWITERNNLAKYMIVFSVIMVCAYVMVFVWIYPIMAAFKNTISKNIWNALALAVRHFPWTLLLCITAAGSVILGFYVSYFLLFLLAIGFGTYAYLYAFLFNHIFKGYIEQEQEREAQKEAEAQQEAEAQLAEPESEEASPAEACESTPVPDPDTGTADNIGKVTRTGNHVTYVNAFEDDDTDN